MVDYISLLNIDTYDYIETLVVILMEFFVLALFVKKYKFFKDHLYFLYIYHLVLTSIYIYVSLKISPGDAIGYYLTAEKDAEFGLGTQFIVFVTHYLNFLKFIPLTFLYSFIGFWGIIYFYKSILIVTNGHRSIAFLFSLFPGFHFWTSGIGKDSLIMLPLMFLMYKSLSSRGKKLNIYILTSLMLIFMIRPYITIFLLISLLVGNINFSMRRIIMIVFLLAMLALLLSSTRNLYPSFYKDPISFLEHRSRISNIGHTKIFMFKYPFYIRMLIYLYYPLFPPVFNFLFIGIVVDNIFFLIITLVYFVIFLIRLSRFMSVNVPVYFYFYVILFVFTMSYTTSNLGIIVRQKWMVYPFLLSIFASGIKNNKNKHVWNNRFIY